MQIPQADRKKRDSSNFVAAEDAGRFNDEAAALVESAVGVEWYGEPAEADRATLALCRLRRARAGERGGPRYGDEAVRLVLAEASPQALVWIASRAISYMDESGYPESVERWLD